MTDAPHWVIHRYDTVASTMDVAARLAGLGAPERTAVVSSEQTAGRGRAGRPWQAPPGSSLSSTLIVRPAVPPDRLSTLPLVTGVAVAETIEKLTRASVQLKWPNDVWIGSDPARRKVAGILAISTLRGSGVEHVLVGIGVNVASSPETLPPTATSLLAATGACLTPDDVLTAVLQEFDREYTAFLIAEGRPSLDAWRSRAALLGEHVTIDENGVPYSGIFVGIDDDGGLRLRSDNLGPRKFVAGDVVRGPRCTSR